MSKTFHKVVIIAWQGEKLYQEFLGEVSDQTNSSDSHLSYIALLTDYNMKNKCEKIFDSDSFCINIPHVCPLKSDILMTMKKISLDSVVTSQEIWE